jgi:hypothetical protein
MEAGGIPPDPHPGWDWKTPGLRWGFEGRLQADKVYSGTDRTYSRDAYS